MYLTLPGGIRLFIVVVCEWISGKDFCYLLLMEYLELIMSLLLEYMLYENSCVGYLLSMLSMVDSGIWQKAQVPPYKHAIAAYDTAIVGHFLHIGIHQYGSV